MDGLYVLALLALAFAIFAQIKVFVTFKKYEKEKNHQGLTGCEVARKILDDNGLSYVNVEVTGGHLTDHFDPRTNVIRLSQSVYNGYSISALGVAAHEAGHALQYAHDYSPIKVRSALIPVTRFGSIAAVPLVILGIYLGVSAFISLGIVLYSVLLVFQIVTLPVEFNASERAIDILENRLGLFSVEVEGAKKVLSAAALTYVAAMVSTLITLIRLLALRKR